MNHRPALVLIATTFALAACDGAPQPAAVTHGNTADPTGGLAPPLLAPGQNPDIAPPASYEVSIASAAADHNNALARCTTQPGAVRTQCEQEANAAFAERRASLEALRGNQE